MFKRMTIMAAIAFSLSVSFQATAQTAKKKKTTKVSNVKADVVQGGLLISKSDCLSCHRPTIKLIGPSFQDIAKKYPPTDKNYAMLIEKVTKGGSGNWGPMAMSPHDGVPPADVRKMITYILATK